ncbi:selenocysteine lyase/cysteine desulfurase [Variovorax sp. SG517]|uniref:hypothetical protein n=1 Tax=Variovorax sp. SG517 TaxID=2587117 RepID=UPI00159DED33|nr:hypothetical protein [Variovorax sp. SG517]NVM87594.1 selenocysteine lyase/cysteine desulfurase [Variovorax sp. SG517]
MEPLITPVPHEKLIDASFALAFSGEGAATYVVHGWNALLRRFASETIDYTGAIVDAPEAINRAEREEWLAMFSDPDQWTTDEDGVAYHFTSDVGEISQVSIYRLSDSKAPGLTTLNDDLIAILGRPNFTCIHLAQALRLCGVEIKTKAEHEQAAAIHFLLMRYVRHGQDWAKQADADLRAMLDEAEAKNRAAMS